MPYIGHGQRHTERTCFGPAQILAVQAGQVYGSLKNTISLSRTMAHVMSLTATHKPARSHKAQKYGNVVSPPSPPVFGNMASNYWIFEQHLQRTWTRLPWISSYKFMVCRFFGACRETTNRTSHLEYVFLQEHEQPKLKPNK